MEQAETGQAGTEQDPAVCPCCGRANPGWKGAAGLAEARAMLDRCAALMGRPRGMKAGDWPEARAKMARALAHLRPEKLVALEAEITLAGRMPDWAALREQVRRFGRPPATEMIEGFMRSPTRRELWRTNPEGPMRAVVLLDWLRRVRWVAPSRHTFETEVDPIAAELTSELLRAVRRGDAARETTLMGRVEDAAAVVWPEGGAEAPAFEAALATARGEVAP